MSRGKTECPNPLSHMDMIADPVRTHEAAAEPRLTAFVKDRALAAGFDAVGIVRADSVPAVLGERLEAFLSAGRHGSMGWLEEKAGWRRHPNALWAEARSVIMVALNYGPDTDPLASLERRDRAAISVYARNRDYHDVIKGRLKRLAGQVVARAGGDVKVFVDTAPVMEKPLAALAGLGWQGKHTNLVSREHGSWLFLGAIFTTAELDADTAEVDHCGSCRRCLDICPTDAFPAPYQLDARRCISYLTIEHAGPIPHEFRRAMGNRIYGCDDCLAVCPWNKFAAVTREAKLAARDDLVDPPLDELARLDDAGFRARFSGSPIKRIGRNRFVRNVLIAIGNSGRPDLAEIAGPLTSDPDPAVADAAEWALSELASRDSGTEICASCAPHQSHPIQ